MGELNLQDKASAPPTPHYRRLEWWLLGIGALLLAGVFLLYGPQLWTLVQDEAALEAARQYQDQIVTFLRDTIAIPAESRSERERCERVKQEYEKLGFDEVFFAVRKKDMARTVRPTVTPKRGRRIKKQ